MVPLLRHSRTVLDLVRKNGGREKLRDTCLPLMVVYELVLAQGLESPRACRLSPGACRPELVARSLSPGACRSASVARRLLLGVCRPEL